jgi:hypothetical protein
MFMLKCVLVKKQFREFIVNFDLKLAQMVDNIVVYKVVKVSNVFHNVVLLQFFIANVFHYPTFLLIQNIRVTPYVEDETRTVCLLNKGSGLYRW